jgi:hypothetical protein
MKKNLKSLIETIIDKRKYVYGWDGYDGIPINDSTVIDGIKLLLNNIFLNSPIISYAGDGELSFYWSNSNLTMLISLYGNGLYEYGGINKITKEELEDEDIDINEPIPKNIMELINIENNNEEI